MAIKLTQRVKLEIHQLKWKYWPWWYQSMTTLPWEFALQIMVKTWASCWTSHFLVRPLNEVSTNCHFLSVFSTWCSGLGGKPYEIVFKRKTKLHESCSICQEPGAAGARPVTSMAHKLLEANAASVKLHATLEAAASGARHRALTWATAARYAQSSTVKGPIPCIQNQPVCRTHDIQIYVTLLVLLLWAAASLCWEGKSNA